MKTNLRAWDGNKFHYLGESAWLIHIDSESGKLVAEIKEKDKPAFKATEIHRWTENTTQAGTPIYEGDIIILKSGQRAKVTYSPDQGGFLYELPWNKNQHSWPMNGDTAWTCQVIGNVFQNPDLDIN